LHKEAFIIVLLLYTGGLKAANTFASIIEKCKIDAGAANIATNISCDKH
jgi:hypothetical protein